MSEHEGVLRCLFIRQLCDGVSHHLRRYMKLQQSLGEHVGHAFSTHVTISPEHITAWIMDCMQPSLRLYTAFAHVFDAVKFVTNSTSY
jgi:hypothetical protein